MTTFNIDVSILSALKESTFLYITTFNIDV